MITGQGPWQFVNTNPATQTFPRSVSNVTARPSWSTASNAGAGRLTPSKFAAEAVRAFCKCR